jgi:hypothetical protein
VLAKLKLLIGKLPNAPAAAKPCKNVLRCI